MSSRINEIFKKTAAEFKKQYGISNDLSRLKFCSNGAAMINGLRFSFVIDNIGGTSDSGFCVAISGDAVADGSFGASPIELVYGMGGKQTKLTKKLSKVVKKDGKTILQAKFSGLHLESGLTSESDEEKRFAQKMQAQLHFSFTPSYSADKDAEVMITVYPYDNILEGAANKWIYACSDPSSLIKYL